MHPAHSYLPWTCTGDTLWLSARQTADLLGADTNLVRYWASRRLLTVFRPLILGQRDTPTGRRKYLFRQDEVELLLKAASHRPITTVLLRALQEFAQPDISRTGRGWQLPDP